MGVYKYQVLLCIGVIVLANEVHGLGLHKHITAIQEYIMAGYGDGWKHCDILSANLEEAGFDEDIPHFAVTLEKLLTIDIGSTLSSSHCILALYEIDTPKNLASIMEFGWKVIQYKRIALILKMGSGLTLDHNINTTKLPFPVAAEVENGEEQFICPIIGKVEPLLQEHMCEQAYITLEKKTLRIGMVGYQLFGKKTLNHCIAQICFQFILHQYHFYSYKKWPRWYRYQVAEATCKEVQLCIQYNRTCYL